jgi:hypothetical protein
MLVIFFSEEEINSIRSIEYGVESYSKEMPELGQYCQVMLKLPAPSNAHRRIPQAQIT